MIFVDSSVWIDYFNGKFSWQTDALDQLLGKRLVVVGDLIYVEVLQGFYRESDFNSALNGLDLLCFREMMGRSIAIQSARHYRLLKKKGVTVRKTMDVIIGTFCIENDLELLHNDRDFEPMERHLGLKVYRP